MGGVATASSTRMPTSLHSPLHTIMHNAVHPLPCRLAPTLVHNLAHTAPRVSGWMGFSVGMWANSILGPQDNYFGSTRQSFVQGKLRSLRVQEDPAASPLGVLPIIFTLRGQKSYSRIRIYSSFMSTTATRFLGEIYLVLHHTTMGQEMSAQQGVQRAMEKAQKLGRADARAGKMSTRDIDLLDDRMKAKLQRGVNYNMKVVLRGAAKTGKSSLLRRLQGKQFDPNYIKTSRIQSANINWSYRETNDVVKVEVWDVVDKGFVEQSTAAAFTSRARSLFQGARGLPMTQEEMIADASTVDVYRGTHAAVFLFDVTRRDTFDYIKRELPSVPSNVHVLMLGNFYDRHSNAVVPPQEIRDLVKARNSRHQGTNDGRCYHLNTSMKDCFGLTELYGLLNLPFLSLKVSPRLSS